ncbi:hypothetical protein DPEC_G00198740, partial [Dallia pectoralis]
MSEKNSRKQRMGSSRRHPRLTDVNKTNKDDDDDDDDTNILSEQNKGLQAGTDSGSVTHPTDPVSLASLSSAIPEYTEDNSHPSLIDFPESQLSLPGNQNLLELPVNTGKRKKMGSTRKNKGTRGDRDVEENQNAEPAYTDRSLEPQPTIAAVEPESQSNTGEEEGTRT